MVCFFYNGGHYDLVQFKVGEKFSCVIRADDPEQIVALEEFLANEYKEEIRTSSKYAMLVAKRDKDKASPTTSGGGSAVATATPTCTCAHSVGAAVGGTAPTKGDFSVKISGCPGARDSVLKVLKMIGVRTENITSMSKSKGLHFREVTFMQRADAETFRRKFWRDG